jgi:hypothetical protein
MDHVNNAPRAKIKETKAKVLTVKDSFLKFQGIECTVYITIFVSLIIAPDTA